MYIGALTASLTVYILRNLLLFLFYILDLINVFIKISLNFFK